jgi:hypothetical protein
VCFFAVLRKIGFFYIPEQQQQGQGMLRLCSVLFSVRPDRSESRGGFPARNPPRSRMRGAALTGSNKKALHASARMKGCTLLSWPLTVAIHPISPWAWLFS